MAEYHPQRSTTSADTLARFIRSPLNGDLNAVPGIGPVAIEELKEAGITTSYQLLSKFMEFKRADCSSMENCELFWLWLKDHCPKLRGTRSAVVQACAMKLDIAFPGLYDPDAYPALER